MWERNKNNSNNENGELRAKTCINTKARLERETTGECGVNRRLSNLFLFIGFL